MRLFTLFVALFVFAMTANAQTSYLRIVYDSTKGMGGQDGGDLVDGGFAASAPNKVYMHSGAGPWSYFPDGQDWGVDHGIGEMTNEGNGVYSLEILWPDYYNVPEGVTTDAIGLVFRNEDGTLVGKDADGADIYIRGLDTPEPYVENSSGTIFNGVTATWLEEFTGIEDFAANTSISVVPNPVMDYATVTYTTDNENVNVRVYNTAGQVVAQLAEGFHTSGTHTISWNNEQNLAAGTYIITIEGAKGMVSEKVVIAR